MHATRILIFLLLMTAPLSALAKSRISAAEHFERIDLSHLGLAGMEPSAEEILQSGEFSGKDDDSGLKFCHTAKWSKACLKGLLAYRCAQYTFPLMPYGCAATASSMVEYLELERIDVVFDDESGKPHTYNLPVIFTKKLRTMITNPTIQEEIRTLRRLLETAAEERKPFDLWTWALALQKGNFEKAVEWLTVLLQDTSAVQIQVEYLRYLQREGKLSPKTYKATQDLSEITYFLSYENLESIQWREFLKLYPPTKNLEAELTPLIYHFYPMAYLALKLKPRHGKRLASFLPFLFNTEYLCQDLDPEMWPMHHPRPEKINLKSGRIQWKMKDLYGGYTGGLLGVKKLDRTPGLKAIQEAYAKDPYKMMQKLLWTMP